MHLCRYRVCGELSNQVQHLFKIHFIRNSPLQTFARAVVQYQHRLFDVLIRILGNILRFGKYSRNSPLVFSFMPRCHGGGMYIFIPDTSATCRARLQSSPHSRCPLSSYPAAHKTGNSFCGRPASATQRCQPHQQRYRLPGRQCSPVPAPLADVSTARSRRGSCRVPGRPCAVAVAFEFARDATLAPSRRGSNGGDAPTPGSLNHYVFPFGWRKMTPGAHLCSPARF